MAPPGSRVRLDLNSPEFQDVLFRLESPEPRQAIASLTAPNGARVHSLRISQRVRAVGYRDGDLLRLISLHPDHDSAYEK